LFWFCIEFNLRRASQSTATLIYALRITLNGRGTSKRDTASGSRSSEIINPNQSAADELSNILERNLTDYWIRKKGGALSLETGEILQVEYISVKNLRKFSLINWEPCSYYYLKLIGDT